MNKNFLIITHNKRTRSFAMKPREVQAMELFNRQVKERSGEPEVTRRTSETARPRGRGAKQ